MTVRRGEWAVLAVTLLYGFGFTAWFLATGNAEFIVYVVTMTALVLLIASSLRRAEYPMPMLWALTFWGFLHMAGGGVPAGDGVLYGLVLVPIVTVGDTVILKYDQVVHAYGFGVTAWLLRHLLLRNFPAMRGSASVNVYPALAAMGLGAVNEMVEFSAVLAVRNTGVGGYYNTLLDLCFNALGAVCAVLVLRALDRADRPV